MKGIVLFDFDGTITKNDTFISFGCHCFGKAGLLKNILKVSPWLVMWKLGIIKSSEAKEKLFKSMFKKMSYGRFKKLCATFVPHIENNLRDDIMQTLKNHIKDGRRICIVSASIEDWIFPWAQKNGISDVIATQVELDDDVKELTGRFKTPNCLGEEKVRRIIEKFPDFHNTESWAYGDSNDDMPMLNISSHPYKL